MKLFKKLAAVALAAVLALSMVGCGATADIKSQINDYIDDLNVMDDAREITHKNDLDTVAGKLIDAANDAAPADAIFSTEQMKAFLVSEEVVATADISEGENYWVTFIRNYDYKSNFANGFKIGEIASNLTSNYSNSACKIGNPHDMHYDTSYEYGIAVGKIGEQEYIVMLKVPGENEPV